MKTKLENKIKEIESEYNCKLVKTTSKIKANVKTNRFLFEDKRPAEVIILSDEKNKVISGSILDYVDFQHIQF